MLPYLLVLIIVTVIAVMMNKLSSSTTVFNVFLFMAFASMVLVAGLRNASVGTDTSNYVRYFKEIESFADFLRIARQGGEYGFWFLTWLAHAVSDNYVFFLTAVALIVVGCYQRAIVTYSENYGISFFVFIAMGFYTFFFNGARQGVACAICALTIGPLLQRNFRKYFCYILIACLFHKTAIIMLPVYLIFNSDNSLKKNLFYGVIGIIGSLTLQKVVTLGSQIDERYKDYATAGEGGGYLMVGFSCALALFFLLFRNKVLVGRERYNLFLNMLVFGTTISLVSAFAKIDPSGVLRLTLYFNVSVIFMWPIVFRNLYNRSLRMLVSYVFILGYAVFFILTTTRFSDLVPYSLNPSLRF